MKKCFRCKSEIDDNESACPKCRTIQPTKKQKKIIRALLIFLGSLLFLLILIITIAMNTETRYDCSNAKFITVDKLYEELSNNKAKAKELYDNKVYKIVGYATKISDTTLLGDTASPVYSIEIYFQDSENNKVISLNKGDKITVCGKIQIDEPAIVGFTTWDIKEATMIEND